MRCQRQTINCIQKVSIFEFVDAIITLKYNSLCKKMFIGSVLMNLLTIFNPQNAVFRIHSIEMFNFRNIEHSKITFPDSETCDLHDELPSVLGIYGQNGSGKTSVVLSLALLKQLASGRTVKPSYASYIRSGYDRAKLIYEFSIINRTDSNNTNLSITDKYISSAFSKSTNYEITYSVDIVCVESFVAQNNEPQKVIQIENEQIYIKMKTEDNEIIIPKQVFIDTSESSSTGKMQAFGSRSKYKLFTQGDSEFQAELCKEKAELKTQSKSFVFSAFLLKMLYDKFAAMNAIRLVTAYFQTIWFLEELHLEESQDNGATQLIKNLLSTNCEIDGFNYNAETINSADEDTLEKYFIQFLLLLLDGLKKEFNTSTDIDSITDEDTLFEALFSVFDELITNNHCKELSSAGYFLMALYTISSSITEKLHVIGTNRNLPLVLRYNEYNDFTKKYESTYRVIPLKIDGKSIIDSNSYAEIVDSISRLSMVLSRIVPNLTLTVKECRTITEDNVDKKEIEILANRNDVTIPLPYESDGIRRLVSLISPLIGVYNDPSIILVVDEIDTGLYEFLIGEILQSMVTLNENQQPGKGQLIFTAHNLRPLEVLPYRSIVFTTNDPNNRFKTISLRGNSNLRDIYEKDYRKTVLGLTDKKEIRSDIAKALLQARG